MTDVEPSWSVSEVRAPVGLLLLAALLAALGVVCLFLHPIVWWSTTGYAVASVGAISVIGVFRFADGRARLRRGYRVTPSLERICQILLVVSWLISVADGWRLATELAR